MMKVVLCVVLMAAVVAVNAQTDVKLMPCSPDATEYQVWDFTGPKMEIRLKSNMGCLDVQGYSKSPGAEVYVWQPCHPEDTDPDHQNESWNITSSGTIVQPMSGLCLAAATSALAKYTAISIYNCNGQAYQNWYVNKSDSTLRPTAAPTLCLDGGSPNPRPCDIDPGKSLPFCDTTLDFETRAWDIVNRLQTEEKPTLFANGAGAVPRLGLPPYQWWSEALHGTGNSPGVQFADPTPYATSFSQVIHTGASFNKTLWHAIGSVISTESRVMNNYHHAGLTFWAPNINEIPDPRWGRGQETPGEDPYATGIYAANFVPGMQEGEDMRYLKVSSCSKHFFDYNLENWGGVDRHHFDAISSDRDIADTYLPMFEASVRYGHASGLMCSYNSVNGVPSCVNYPLLTTIARVSWGFQGYVTGDCGAVDDVIDTHKYFNNASAVVNGVLTAGLDIDCGGFVPGNLIQTINQGAITNDTINTALFHLFMMQMRLGMFDPVDQQIYTQYGLDKINTPDHQKLALENAQQGFVLLKNANNRLPLSASQINSIVMSGCHADATGALQGNYAGNAPYLISPIQGVKTYVSNVNMIKGCNDVACSDTSHFGDAVKAAANADVVIVVVGIDQSVESEGNDRTEITLPGNQNLLVQQIANASKSPIIVVSMSGGAVDIGDMANNPKVGALIWSGYSGQSGGQGVADVLFGTYNPSGRLPYTIYPADFVNEADMLDRHMRPNKTATGRPGRTYRFYTGTPVFEYGSGLSYTTFEYHNSTMKSIRVNVEEVENYIRSIQGQHRYFREGAPEADTISITVKNTGNVAGADIVQCFVSGPTPGLSGNSIKDLIGFEKVWLQPGEETTVQFPVAYHDLTLTAASGTRVSQKGTWHVRIHHQDKVVIPIVVA